MTDKINLELLKAVPLDGFEKYLSEDSLRVYNTQGKVLDNEVLSLESDYNMRHRYLRVLIEWNNNNEVDRQEIIEEKKKWMAKRLNKISDKFESVIAPLSFLELNQTEVVKKGVMFLFLIIKQEFIHLTKEDLNSL